MTVYFSKIRTLSKVQKVQNVLSDSGPSHKAQKQGSLHLMIRATAQDWKPTCQPFGQNNAFKMDYQAKS